MRGSFNEQGQFIFDATSIEMAQTCLRKYYYSMIKNLEPKHKSVHLIFGGIYAASLERFYLHRAEGLSIDEALRKVVRYAMVESWDAETQTPVHFDSAVKTRANLIRTIVWYVEEFGEESTSGIQTFHLSNGKPAVELSFVLEMDDSFMYAGHLDRVVEYGDGLYWMDQKTTGTTISTYYFDQFKPSNQFYGYTWAGQTILNSPVRGGIIDAAQIAQGFSRFGRQPITVSKDTLDEWVDNARHTMYTVRSSFMLNKWPMNLTACGNYGGCPFRELCTRPPSVREKFETGNFQIRKQPWDPATPR